MALTITTSADVARRLAQENKPLSELSDFEIAALRGSQASQPAAPFAPVNMALRDVEKARNDSLIQSVIESGFDPNQYVSGLNYATLNDIIQYGANLETEDQRRAARIAAQRRMNELAPPVQPTGPGMGMLGTQQGVTPTAFDPGVSVGTMNLDPTRGMLTAPETLTTGQPAFDPNLSLGVPETDTERSMGATASSAQVSGAKETETEAENPILDNFNQYQSYLNEIDTASTLRGARAGEDLAYVPGSGSGGEAQTDALKAARSRAYQLGEDQGLFDPETGRFLDIGFDYVYDGMNVNTTGNPGEYAARVDTDRYGDMVKPVFDAIITNIATQGLTGLGGFNGGVQGVTNPLDPNMIVNLANQTQQDNQGGYQATEDVPPELQQGDIYGPGGLFDISIMDYPNAYTPPEQEGGGSSASEAGGSSEGGAPTGGSQEAPDTELEPPTDVPDGYRWVLDPASSADNPQWVLIQTEDPVADPAEEEGLTLGQPDWWNTGLEPDYGGLDTGGDSTGTSGADSGDGGTGGSGTDAGQGELVTGPQGTLEDYYNTGGTGGGTGTGAGTGSGDGVRDTTSTPLTTSMFSGMLGESEADPFMAGISSQFQLLRRLGINPSNYLAQMLARRNT